MMPQRKQKLHVLESTFLTYLKKIIYNHCFTEVWRVNKLWHDSIFSLQVLEMF